MTTQLAVEVHSSKRFPQLVDQLDTDGRKIVDEIERFFDLVRDTCGVFLPTTRTFYSENIFAYITCTRHF